MRTTPRTATASDARRYRCAPASTSPRLAEAFDFEALEPGCADRTCHHCGHPGGQRWGRHGDHQRYRCPSCRRTWTAASGAAGAGIRKRDAWLMHLASMTGGGSTRGLAAELGVTPRTIGRWRRKLMRLMNERLPRRLGGRIEVMPWRPYYSSWMQLLVAVEDAAHNALCDDVEDLLEERAGAVALILPSPPTIREVAGVYRCHFEPGSELILNNPFPGAFWRGAEAAGLAVRCGGISAAMRYAHRLKPWLRRFYGTEYTQSYLAWFDAVQTLPDAQRFVAHWSAEAALPSPRGCSAKDLRQP